MKRFLFVLALLLLVLARPARAAELSAKSAVVYEPRTGTVLLAQDAETPMLVASTTKIMTALVVLENCALNEPVTVTKAHQEVEGSSAWLVPGGTYTVEDVLYGLLLNSGNDAAAALADHCAGSMEAFAALMNEKCAALGLAHTHFVNSHGLDDPEHYSCALDLARLTAAAMENPVFSRIFGTYSREVRGVEYVNHNKLLLSCPGCIGGKTGYTMAAGRVLVSCAEREGMRLICVTISDPDDWLDHAALYDAYFGAWQYVPVPGDGWLQMSVISGERDAAALRCSVPGFLLPRDVDTAITVRIPRFVFAPVLEGQRVGTVLLRCSDGTLLAAEVFAAEHVALDPTVPLTRWEKFRRMWFFASRAPGAYIVDV